MENRAKEVETQSIPTQNQTKTFLQKSDAKLEHQAAFPKTILDRKMTKAIAFNRVPQANKRERPANGESRQETRDAVFSKAKPEKTFLQKSDAKLEKQAAFPKTILDRNVTTAIAFNSAKKQERASSE
jgi:hypothetical protein